MEGFEADDVLGTVAEMVQKNKEWSKGIKIIIASGDMDTLQLVKNDEVVVYTLKKESTKRLFTTKKR